MDPATEQSLSGIHYIKSMVEFLVGAIRRRLLLLLILPLLAAAAAWISVTTQPPVYQGYVTLESGRISDQPIQSPQFLVDRIYSPTFKNSVMRALNLNPLKDKSAAMILATISPRAVPGSDPGRGAVEVSVRGYSEQQLVDVLKTITRLIGEQQAAITEPKLQTLRAKLQLTKSEIARRDTERKRLADIMDDQVSGKAPDNDQAAEMFSRLQLIQMIANADDSILKMRNDEVDLTEHLSPQNTFTARALEDISITPAAVISRRLYFAVVAWVGTLALCLLFAIATVRTRLDSR